MESLPFVQKTWSSGKGCINQRENTSKANRVGRDWHSGDKTDDVTCGQDRSGKLVEEPLGNFSMTPSLTQNLKCWPFNKLRIVFPTKNPPKPGVSQLSVKFQALHAPRPLSQLFLSDCEISHRQYVNEWASLCSSKTSFTNTISHPTGHQFADP